MRLLTPSTRFDHCLFTVTHVLICTPLFASPHCLSSFPLRAVSSQCLSLFSSLSFLVAFSRPSSSSLLIASPHCLSSFPSRAVSPHRLSLLSLLVAFSPPSSSPLLIVSPRRLFAPLPLLAVFHHYRSSSHILTVSPHCLSSLPLLIASPP
jgi:hypothetical protein